MANHKSAKKRSLQSKVKNAVNSQYLTKIRTNLNKFNISLKNNDGDYNLVKSFTPLVFLCKIKL